MTWPRQRHLTTALPALLLVLAAGCESEPPPSPEVLLQRQIIELFEEYDKLRGVERREQGMPILERMLEVDPHHPRPYRAAVMLHMSGSQWDEAEALLSEMGEEGPGRTIGLGLVAYFRAIEKKNWDVPETILREALGQYERREHSAGQANAHNILGLTFMGRSQRTKPPERTRVIEQALAEYRAAYEIYNRLEDISEAATALNNIGRVRSKRMEFDQAIAVFEETLLLRQRLGDGTEQWKSQRDIGNTQHSAGRHEQALESLLTAKRMAEQADTLGGRWLVHRDLAKLNVDLHRNETAEVRFRECLEFSERMVFGERDWMRRGWILRDLGDFLSDTGRHEEAIAMLEEAVEASRTAKDQKNVCRSFQALGTAQIRSWKLSAAAESLKSAIREGRGVRGAVAPVATAYTDLGLVHLSRGELADALLAAQVALRLRKRLEPAHRLAALNNAGLIYHRLGDFESAQGHLRQALEMAAEQENHELEALARNNLGIVLIELDRPQEALEQFAAALTLGTDEDLPRLAGLARLNTAEVQWELGRHDEARPLMDQAIDDLRRAGARGSEAYALLRWGDFARDDGEGDLARDRYAESLELSQTYGFRTMLPIIFASLAELHADEGRVEPALAEYSRALDAIESMRSSMATDTLKMKFLAKHHEIYERSVILQASAEPAPGARAFVLAEAARGRALLDLLTESQASLRDSLPQELAAEESRLVDDVSVAAWKLAESRDERQRRGARTMLATAEQKLEGFKLEMRRQAPIYSQIVYPQPGSLDEIRNSVLHENETLLRYFIGENHARLWIVDRAGAQLHELPPPTLITEQVRAYLDAASKVTRQLGGRIPGAAQAQALADTLLVGKVPEGRRLIVVPDGPLHLVPFEALRPDGTYLIERNDVVVVPSPTTLKLMRESPPQTAREGFLGIGDPLVPEDDERFPPLPASAATLDRIGALFPSGQTVLLTKAASNKKGLAQQPLDRFRYIHFATHGWLDRDNPRHFGLLLSTNDKGRMEFLHLDDIFSMKLGAELVVLSACESGLGEQLRGEGLVGMTRGFLYAGARSVLVSLWRIDDRSTGQFMETFYGHLAGGMSVPAALRQTKLDFIGSERPTQRQPYRWAPFILVGNPDTDSIPLNRKARLATPGVNGEGEIAVR